MINIIIIYFIFGAGFYIGLTANNPCSFKNGTTASLIRGFLLGFIFWPVGLIYSIIRAI